MRCIFAGIEGEQVITMDMNCAVKRMHFRDHLSFSDIARRAGLSRTIVETWAKTPAEQASV